MHKYYIEYRVYRFALDNMVEDLRVNICLHSINL